MSASRPIDVFRPTALQLAVLAAALLLPLQASAGSCDEKFDDCVEDCRIEFGMEVGRQQLFKCLKRCDTGRGDCTEYRRSERELQKREREQATREQVDLPLAPEPAYEPAPETEGLEPAPVRAAAEDALPEPREGEERALVRIEGARDKVVGLANIDDFELVLHSGKQLGNDRMAVSAWASPGALTEVKSRGCRVKVLMSAEKVRQSWKRRAPSRSSEEKRADDHADFERGGEE